MGEKFLSFSFEQILAKTKDVDLCILLLISKLFHAVFSNTWVH